MKIPSYRESLAHHLIEERGLFLKDAWDFDKNGDLLPHLIFKNRRGKNRKGEDTRVWIKCQNKEHHGSYEMITKNFTLGRRCQYCSSQKVNVYDSFGYIYFYLAQSWSYENDISPFEVSQSSGKIYKFNCPKCNDTHERAIYSTIKIGTMCKKMLNIKR